MKKNDIVALVPVKANSERVKSKNLRKFADTNLLELKLSHLKKVKNFKKIIVSSESDKVLKIASNYNFNVHKRDPKYSTSHVPMSEVYSYIASEIDGEFIAWINITNPLATSSIYEDAISKFREIKSNYDCLLSAYEIQENLYFDNKRVNFPRSPWPRSQDLKPVYSLSFVINILKRTDMIKWGSCVGKNPYFYLLDKITSWDIDDKTDFDFCEYIYKTNYKKILS